MAESVETLESLSNPAVVPKPIFVLNTVEQGLADSAGEKDNDDDTIITGSKAISSEFVETRSERGNKVKQVAAVT